MDKFDENDIDRDEIRANLSTMSFEDLQALKDKIGAKLYNETVFGTNSNEKRTPFQSEFKRENKNRPREMSSKRPIFHKDIPSKKNIPRDPRFDPLCGTFDEKIFKKSYKFVNKIKLDERRQLKEELANTEDPKKKKQIKYLIQRIDNQIREQEKTDEEKGRIIEEKNEIKTKLKHGEKPEYFKKSEKKIVDLLTKYEELKQSKKLQKHIEKRSKKNSRKDFKKMPEIFNN